MTNEIIQKSIFIPLPSKDTLHLRRLYRDPNGPPVFMLHGSIENGRIFYTDDGRGLAPYLARNGYDVFVADLRGRGLSTPPIRLNSRYGQTEAITEDIPAFVKTIRDLKGEIQQRWIAHSWGGVLMAAHLARLPESLHHVRSMVFFATKRTIRVRHLEKWLKINVFWFHIGRLLTALWGYLPAKELRFGSDNETKRSFLANVAWVKPSPWLDPEDGFSYEEAIKKLELPPTLHLVGAADTYLGHPLDISDFIKETAAQEVEYRLLGHKNGNLHDYGHTSILTHPDAGRDHFPIVLEWLKR